MAIFWERTNEAGAFWGLAVGLIMGIVRMITVFTIPAPGCGEPDIRIELINSLTENFKSFRTILQKDVKIEIFIWILLEFSTVHKIYRLGLHVEMNYFDLFLIAWHLFMIASISSKQDPRPVLIFWAFSWASSISNSNLFDLKKCFISFSVIFGIFSIPSNDCVRVLSFCSRRDVRLRFGIVRFLVPVVWSLTVVYFSIFILIVLIIFYSLILF